MRHEPITVKGHVFNFYIYSERVAGSGDLTARMAGAAAALNRLPIEHIRLIVEPILVVDRFPHGRRTGGGWFPPVPAEGEGLYTVKDWLHESSNPREYGVNRTHVSRSDLLGLVGGAAGTGVGGHGIIGITSIAFLKGSATTNVSPYHFTILHEVGHSVDHHSGLTSAATLNGRSGNAPYQGQTYAGGRRSELAAEAYSRFWLVPNRMCRGAKGDPPCNQSGANAPDPRCKFTNAQLAEIDVARSSLDCDCPTQALCSGRLQRDLQHTDAFRMVTSTVIHYSRAHVGAAPGTVGTRELDGGVIGAGVNRQVYPQVCKFESPTRRCQFDNFRVVIFMKHRARNNLLL